MSQHLFDDTLAIIKEDISRNKNFREPISANTALIVFLRKIIAFFSPSDGLTDFLYVFIKSI